MVSEKVNAGAVGSSSVQPAAMSSRAMSSRCKLPPGFRRAVVGDGDDGDGQGSQFWAVRHSPEGEAPFSAPQAKKILRPKCRFTEF